MPIGINRRDLAGLVERGDLVGCQIPADGIEVLAQLFLVSCSDDDGRHGGRWRSQFNATCGTVLPVSLATASQRVDHRVQVFVCNLWS